MNELRLSEIGRPSFLCSLEVPEIFDFFACGYASYKSVLSWLNALWQGSSIICEAVCSILPVGGLSKVREAIVVFASIDVIDLVKWPFAGHIEPREPMDSILYAINSDGPVSFPVMIPSPISRFNGAGAVGRRLEPVKKSSLRIISQKGFESLDCYHVSDNYLFGKGSKA